MELFETTLDHRDEHYEVIFTYGEDHSPEDPDEARAYTQARMNGAIRAAIGYWRRNGHRDGAIKVSFTQPVDLSPNPPPDAWPHAVSVTFGHVRLENGNAYDDGD